MKFFLYILFVFLLISCSKNNVIDENDPIDIPDTIPQSLTLAQLIDSIVGTYNTTKITYWDTSGSYNYRYDTMYNVPLIITKLNDSMFELEGRKYIFINFSSGYYEFMNYPAYRPTMYYVFYNVNSDSIYHSHSVNYPFGGGFNQFGHK